MAKIDWDALRRDTPEERQQRIAVCLLADQECHRLQKQSKLLWEAHHDAMKAGDWWLAIALIGESYNVKYMQHLAYGRWWIAYGYEREENFDEEVVSLALKGIRSGWDYQRSLQRSLLAGSDPFWGDEEDDDDYDYENEDETLPPLDN